MGFSRTKLQYVRNRKKEHTERHRVSPFLIQHPQNLHETLQNGRPKVRRSLIPSYRNQLLVKHELRDTHTRYRYSYNETQIQHRCSRQSKKPKHRLCRDTQTITYPLSVIENLTTTLSCLEGSSPSTTQGLDKLPGRPRGALRDENQESVSPVSCTLYTQREES